MQQIELVISIAHSSHIELGLTQRTKISCIFSHVRHGLAIIGLMAQTIEIYSFSYNCIRLLSVSTQ